MRTMAWMAALGAAALLAAGCSSDDSEPAASTGSVEATDSTEEPTAAEVEPATLEGPVTVGELSGPADPRSVDLAAIGYVQEEWFASGTATSYRLVGEVGEDGEWEAEPADTAPYKTRLIVRRPADAADFSGTVVVEWLNVSVVEAAPDWTYTGRALIDDGAAWIGLSAQAVTIEGGESLLQSGDEPQDGAGGLVNTNPERYGSLEHPGDTFAFDIYSQVAAAVREPGDAPVLGQGDAERVVAAGESQSAAFLTTYVNAVQPRTEAFDGFFVHSRGSSGAQLDGSRNRMSEAVHLLRTDLDVPVMQFETETDVGPLLRFGRARQPDHDLLRTWEVAGTAHADTYLVGGEFAACPYPVNSGPQHWVATAAMAALLDWVEDGTPPPRADPIETTGDGTVISRDDDGIAVGGIRTPAVDVPIAVLSGEGEPGAPVLCALFGKSTPFTPEQLQDRYGSRDAYLEAFDASLQEAVDAGFVRPEDQAAWAAEAREVTFP